jgi:hypothetical protein
VGNLFGSGTRYFIGTQKLGEINSEEFEMKVKTNVKAGDAVNWGGKG